MNRGLWFITCKFAGMTVQSAIKYLRDQLIPLYGEGESVAISDWVLRHITGMEKTDRTSRDLVLTAFQSADMERILARLLTHEPIQYVLNESWFCGLRLSVNRHVLIPRPETEELVEWMISNCRFPVSELTILDIGTGSGCIAISLKRRIRKAIVWACDISPGAIETAMQNASNLGTEIEFRQLDILDERQWESLPMFDIIVSNPPYIPDQEREEMDKNVTDWEPSTALFVPDQDALLFYKKITELAGKKLRPEGLLYFEVHENRGLEVINLLEAKRFTVETKDDMQGKLRMIKVEFKN